LLDGSEIKFVRTYPQKKTAAIFFVNKEDAEKAVADFNGKYVP